MKGSTRKYVDRKYLLCSTKFVYIYIYIYMHNPVEKIEHISELFCNE